MGIKRTEFIQAWQSSDSISDVMQKLDWTGSRQSLISRASLLRREGLPLKRFKSIKIGSTTVVETLESATLIDQFMRIWETSVSVSEVAARLGIPHTSVLVIARNLREQELYLKYFLRSRRTTFEAEPKI